MAAHYNVVEANNPGSAVTVGTGSTAVVAASLGRNVLILSNDSANIIYLRFAATGAVVSQGMRLNANGGNVLIESYRGPVCAVASGAGSVLCVTEL